jgi:hypothetical protein
LDQPQCDDDDNGQATPRLRRRFLVDQPGPRAYLKAMLSIIAFIALSCATWPSSEAQ